MCLPDRWWGLFGEPVYDGTKNSGFNKLGWEKKFEKTFSIFSLIPNLINHIFNVK